MHYTPPLPTISLEKFEKRYKSARRRKKMMPLYDNMLTAVSAQAQPQALFERFAFHELDALHPWAADQTDGFVLGLVTLGEAIDQQAAEIAADDLVAASIMEEITLAMIVGLANDMRSRVQEQLGEALKVGPAYRPGIGRWPIELQSLMFKKLPAAEIGVALNEFMVMIPGRSTSLIIPLLKMEQT